MCLQLCRAVLLILEASWEMCTTLTSRVSHGQLVVVLRTSVIHNNKPFESEDQFVIWLPLACFFVLVQSLFFKQSLITCLSFSLISHLDHNSPSEAVTVIEIFWKCIWFEYSHMTSYSFWLWFRWVILWGITFVLIFWDKEFIVLWSILQLWETEKTVSEFIQHYDVKPIITLA